MGLFDFFKNKKKSSASEPGIEIVPLNDGSQGDNLGGLFGFEFKNTPDSTAFIYEQIDKTSETPIVMRNNDLSVDVKEMSFDASNENRSRLKMRVIEHDGKMLSAFPYLKTAYSIPFTTQVVHPWAHVENIEAEIYGAGRDTFAVGFFATDYIANEEKYQQNNTLEICISAIGLVLDRFENFENNEGLKLSPDFASYMPSQDINRITYYDFIGKLIDFEEVNVAKENSGYILRVKLINDEEDPDFFTIDMFINKQNMRISELEKGMSVTGALWFQGEIKV
jgi:hypothetical protein